MIRGPDLFWAAVRIVVVILSLAVWLKLTATTFDETEANTIHAMFWMLVGIEGVVYWLGKRRRNDG